MDFSKIVKLSDDGRLAVAIEFDDEAMDEPIITLAGIEEISFAPVTVLQLCALSNMFADVAAELLSMEK